MDAALIAPCGFNCALCLTYQDRERPCEGCNGDDAQKKKLCAICAIHKCDKHSPSGFCYECDVFPCRQMREMDSKHQKMHRTSLIGNLHYIRDCGMDAFLAAERERWTCKNCGETACIHKDMCLQCETPLS